MYELILYNRGSSHMVLGDSLKLEEYPGVEPGTLAFDANSEKVFIAIEDEFVEVAAAAEEAPEVEETPEETTPVVPETPTENPVEDEVANEGEVE